MAFMDWMRVFRTAEISTSSVWLWLILVFAIFIKSSSAGQEIITAETEQDVTLPCQAPDNIIGIEWSRPDLNEEYVLLYRDGRSDPKHQHPSFVNRVYLKDRDMKDGDASLILKNVTTADNGSYECRVRTGTSRRKRAYLEVDPINIIYLSVVDPPVRQEDSRLFCQRSLLCFFLLPSLVVY
ncbi:nectin-4 [Oreochromis niloticus]|uniref:nectin-4 n=1 Tax=Oreochromis niloticus TaxID=8128 RepID=UPI000DF23C9B|nr:nectin-4-like [Oreochromis niloticus]